LGLEQVRFVPASVPPGKEDRRLTPGALRLEMVEAAVAGVDGLAADDIELRRGGVSYTVDTLRALREAEPDVDWHLLVGVDQFASFGRWKEPAEIARLARLCVLDRGGRGAGSVDPGVEVPYRRVEVPRIDVSSTEVRRRARAGLPLAGLVPPAVERIIEREGLYCEGRD